jgi:flavodoxin
MSGNESVLIVYSSRPETGNTRKLAEAIWRRFGDCAILRSVEDAPDPNGFRFVIFGFGVYVGWPDPPMRKYMKTCRNRDIGVFLTLGAYPDSEHAFISLGRAEGLMDTCKTRARFACHGRFHPDRVERMKKRPSDAHHPWTEERATRVAAAASHPNREDLEKAGDVFWSAWEALRQAYEGA